jgi:hypothetical protein
MRVGFGVSPIRISPPVFLVGFGDRTKPAETVHDDLEARAIYLDDGSTKLVLIVCDLLGMSPGFVAPAREAVAHELDVPISNVLISCTHTHSGPSAMAGTEALGWPNPEGLADTIRSACVNAVALAVHAERETGLRYVRAPLPDGFSFNRRGLPYEEPTFNVLDATGDGGRIGTVANMSIHPVLLGPQWLEVATDWIGPFRTALETLRGGTAIQLTGSLGDINPTPPAGQPDDTYAPWASAEQTMTFGTALAEHVAEALDRAEPIEPTLSVIRHETHDIPVGMTPIAALLNEPILKVEFVEWAIGDVRLVSIPGEAFHLLGREIASARGDRVLLAGLSPAWHGYLPRPWGEGYEEGVSYGEEFVNAVRNVLTSTPERRA